MAVVEKVLGKYGIGKHPSSAILSKYGVHEGDVKVLHKYGLSEDSAKKDKGYHHKKNCQCPICLKGKK